MVDADNILRTLGRELDLSFLDRLAVDQAHEVAVEAFGGSPGIRDAGALDGAIARQVQHAAYAEAPEAPDLAAVLAAAIMHNHPYGDGNKRTGLQALLVSLVANGLDLTADDATTTEMLRDVAAGRVDDELFARWVQRHTVPGARSAGADTDGGPGA